MTEFLYRLKRYLVPDVSGEDTGLYILEMKRREWVFIAVRWLWVPVVFLMAWLHEPASRPALWGIGGALAVLNVLATVINLKLQTRRAMENWNIAWLAADSLLGWGIIFLFAYDFYTASYAGYVYIVIQASIRFGLAGGLAAALSFAAGILAAYLFRDIVYDVRFSVSGFAFWTAVMLLVGISTGSVVSESQRLRRISRQRLKDNTLLEERQRIARDLHDTVLKTLQGLALESRALAGRITDEAQKQSAKYIAEVCERTGREMRETVLDLREEGRGTLNTQLTALLQEWQRETGIPVEYRLDCVDMKVDAVTARQLGNIIDEALNNIRRHAGASRVEVSLRNGQDTLELEVRDDGSGMVEGSDISDFPNRGKLGLAGMKERAELLGGDFRLESGEGGTVIRISIPLRVRG